MKQRKKIISIIAIVMAILMAFSLIASVLPTAFAISQSDIDALQKKKDELSARVAEAEERVNTLKNEQANVLDQKTALEEKNNAAKEALALVAEEIVINSQKEDDDKPQTPSADEEKTEDKQEKPSETIRFDMDDY